MVPPARGVPATAVNYPALLHSRLRARFVEGGASLFSDATCRNRRNVGSRSGRSLRGRYFGVNHSYVGKAARKDIDGGVRVPVGGESTRRAGVLAHPQRLVRRDAAGRALFGRPSGFDRDKVRPLPLALVFEQREERSPRGRRGVAAVRRPFHHPCHVQVFDRHKVVLAGVVRRNTVEEVAALSLQVSVAFSDCPALPFPVGRPVFLPRKLPAFAVEAVAFVGEVKRPERETVGIVSELQDTHVNADAPFRFVGLRGGFAVHFDAEGGVPLARGFLLPP